MILLLLATVISLFLFHELYWKRRNYPPGPTPLPFIGNVLSMQFPPPGYEAFNRWTKKYGDIYTFWMGNRPFIMINTFGKIKETFIRDGDTYMNKVKQPFQEEFRGGIYGVIDTNGDVWRDHRRFALTILRDMGVGKDLMQEKILIEVDEIFKKLDSKIGDEVNIPIVLNYAVANIINQTILGYRFGDEKYHEFKKLKDIMDDINSTFSIFSIVIQFLIPWTTSVIGIFGGRKIDETFDALRIKLNEHLNKLIEDHKMKIDYDSEENLDYCEAYLKEQRRRQAEGDFESFSDAQLTNMCLDMWIAGLNTTTNTISWALAYILNNPEVQDKIHEEFDRVIGSDRIITTSDKNDLPYFSAFINETQRCLNLLPINLFHETTRDAVINGYPIKQGTGVIAQIGTVMYDEKVFPEPLSFNPDRFMDNGKLKKVEELNPFSVGKRQCLGEGLARMELFLLLSNFLNRYHASPSKDGPPSLEKSNDSFLVQERVVSGILKKRKQLDY